MKVSGIIAEYNPFHKGHQYHLEQTRSQTGADFCVVVMSGSFVQRGAPAITDKYTRAQMALLGGADVVFELPYVYATASAELFSEAAVSFFDRLGCIDLLSFGSESASLPLLSLVARVLNDEPEAYRNYLQEQLREGQSYPRAVYGAFTRFLLESDTVSSSTIEQVCHLSDQLSMPNNILGIQYLRALLRLGSRIEPFCIQRKGSGYHASALTDHEFCSATALREAIEQGDTMHRLRRYLPEESFELLARRLLSSGFLTSDDLSPYLDYRLLTAGDLSVFADMTPDLALRIQNRLLTPGRFSEWADALKTKNITYTHVCRALLHTLIPVTKEEMIAFRPAGVPYARLLGFRERALPLLHRIKETSQIPVLTKVADAEKKLSPEAYALFEKDLLASDLYRRILHHKTGALLPDEYRAGVIRLS